MNKTHGIEHVTAIESLGFHCIALFSHNNFGLGLLFLDKFIWLNLNQTKESRNQGKGLITSPHTILLVGVLWYLTKRITNIIFHIGHHQK